MDLRVRLVDFVEGLRNEAKYESMFNGIAFENIANRLEKEVLNVPNMQQTSDKGLKGTDEEIQMQCRSCNRHDDCAKADVDAKTRGFFGASHCHDDTCEDCFGC